MAQARIVRSTDGDIVDGMSWRFKATGEQTGGRFDFMVGPIEYLTGPPLHVHDAQDDTFYVLEGVLTLQVGDEIVELGPGEFASVPPGVPHTFDNVHKDQPPVKTINLMTPGGLHAFFKDRIGAEPEAVKALAEQYGMRTVGPPLRETLGLG